MADLPGFAAPEEVKTPVPEHMEEMIDIDIVIDIDNKMEVETPQKDDNNNNDDDDDDQEVQVISPQQAERDAKRKRRRRLYKILKKPGAVPSFLALLTQNEDQLEEDSDDESIPPPVVVIDVDAYLGLKHVFPDGAFSGYDMNMFPIPSGTPSSSSVASARINTNNNTNINPPTLNTPGEEGWYEGCVPLRMPEDKEYLGELQILIRKNLEIFSATDMMVKMSQAGRRTPTVVGKVGIRCIHCTKAVQEAYQQQQEQPNNDDDPSSKSLWPPGAVSYPLSLSGLYSSCAQKPQTHFENCPNLPLSTRAKFWNILQQSRSNQTHDQTAGPPPPKKRRYTSNPINAQLYYYIGCERLGVVEYKGGLRFRRDLSLDPLPFATSRAKMEQDHPQFLPKGQQPSSIAAKPTAGAAVPDATPSVQIPADAHSEQVLAQAASEPDDPKLLARSGDKALVTDYIFLSIRQMAICHATSLDFTTRGKKTRLMRNGFSGFCCRHCIGGNDFSCRSFSSAPDNLASAISNSFVLHLAKCPQTPTRIKDALQVYKRFHPRQMQELPYGSQRRLFHELWERLRVADIPEDQMPATEVPVPVPNTVQVAVASNASEPDAVGSHVPVRKSDLADAELPPVRVDASRDNTRSATNFPVCSDPETQALLKQYEDYWDVAENNEMICPDQRHLVSDYVFLCMRQLKIAIPTIADFKGNRRNNVAKPFAGFCCMHCNKGNTVALPTAGTPSGRSFPSAPDNMASALNSSLYNHMQSCPDLPVELKRVLINLRKIHSIQCQSLNFGSQRKYFNQVYSLLKKIPVDLSFMNSPEFNTPLPKVPRIKSPRAAKPTRAAKAAKAPKTPSSNSRSSRGAAAPVVTAETLAKYHFAQGSSYFQCLRCRMVPFELRAPGSLLFNPPPSMDVFDYHLEDCQGDGVHLGLAGHALGTFVADHGRECLQTLAFKNVVAQVVDGNGGLMRLFTQDILADASFQAASGNNTSAASASVHAPPGAPTTVGLWRLLPTSIDCGRVQTAFGGLATKLNLSSHLLQDNPKFLRFLQIISPSFLESPPSKKNAVDQAAVRTNDDNPQLMEIEDKKVPERSAAAAPPKEAATVVPPQESQAPTTTVYRTVPPKEAPTTQAALPTLQSPTAPSVEQITAPEQANNIPKY